MKCVKSTIDMRCNEDCDYVLWEIESMKLCFWIPLDPPPLPDPLSPVLPLLFFNICIYRLTVAPPLSASLMIIWGSYANCLKAQISTLGIFCHHICELISIFSNSFKTILLKVLMQGSVVVGTKVDLGRNIFPKKFIFICRMSSKKSTLTPNALYLGVGTKPSPLLKAHLSISVSFQDYKFITSSFFLAPFVVSPLKKKIPFSSLPVFSQTICGATSIPWRAGSLSLRCF